MKKTYNIKAIEMIDNNYFYIKGIANFYCVEIMKVNGINNIYELTKFSQQKLKHKQNIKISVKTIYRKISGNFILYVLYKCESLKDLKRGTSTINLAEEKEIISNIHWLQ
ncbi:hypothetical protein [Mammaliicoccus vitulinus]|uniref:hypothetical protein n=1 Tax=Mammaliicoccus vitulinus TaxID=71237 RepID=UPI00248AC867|nr:hypothetical protein [Mammaliicoccus vitulinus]